MARRELPPFANEKVRLRLLKEADLPLTLAWRNQDSIRRWFFHSDIIQPEQHAAWFRQYLERDNDFVFVIEEIAESYRPIGQVALYAIDWEKRWGEYGRLMIGEETARGKGLARAATRLVLQIGFDALDLDEIALKVLANNLVARRIYEGCGFVQDGESEGSVYMTITRPGRIVE